MYIYVVNYLYIIYYVKNYLYIRVILQIQIYITNTNDTGHLIRIILSKQLQLGKKKPLSSVQLYLYC